MSAPPTHHAPLKGIALLDSLYRQDISLRPMSDIDLLVPADQMDRAIECLNALGYIESEPSRRLRHVIHHRTMRRQHAVVELHRRLGDAFIPRSAWPDVAPEPATVHGSRAFRLTAAVEIVHLLIHFYKHRPFVCLGWLDEILSLSEALSSVEQRETLPSVAARLGCCTPLAITVELLRRSLGQNVLPSLRLADLNSSPARVGIHRLLFLDLPDPLRPMVARSRLFEEIHSSLIADSPGDAIKHLFRLSVVHVLTRFPTRITHT